MLTLIALIISIVLQFIAAFIALRLTKRTKYRLSWILISIGLLLMAIRRFLELVSFLNPETTDHLLTFNNWLTVFTSFIITAGVILISELFNYLDRVEISRQEMENKVLNAIIQTEETERKRFAKELHDGLGPLLSSIKMSLSSIKKTNTTLAEDPLFSNTQDTIGESIKTIKEISNNLSPHILNNFGLHSAIKHFAEKISESKQVDIFLESNLSEKRFNENIEIILYRVICELTINTLKHAEAKNIKIVIRLINKSIEIIYSDDGKGFDVKKVMTENNVGMGLRNITSRINSIKGSINIYELIQGGMRTEIKVNISNGKS
jgi:signal transduction histidine kinase